MCGLIAAFCNTPLAEKAAQMALGVMQSRGPDGVGEWRDDNIYFGHRRLAILDLDPRSTQPMHSGCGRYVIVFNGEIYNYRDLRTKLEVSGTAFRTATDTEVLLELFAAEGEGMLSKLHGMFAFVIWDKLTRRAFVARDPYGIKPLYIGRSSDGVLLASQVKALLATGLISREPDMRGQASFWMLGSVAEPHTWYKDVAAVPAGNCLWIEQGQVKNQRCWIDIGKFWREAKVSSSDSLSVIEIQERVRTALLESVQRHLVADVPIGIFLSGGIDSGALAGLMVDAGAKNLQGITIAYDEFRGRHEDEVPFAAEIAAHYGIRHHIRRVGREEFLQDLPKILDAMDQPSIDGVNSWFASKAVAEHGLKVVISGVGGDELFLGYKSFRQLPIVVQARGFLSLFPGVTRLLQTAARWKAKKSGNARWRYSPDWTRSIEGAWWISRSLHVPEELPLNLAAAIQNFSVKDWVGEMVGSLPNNLSLALAQIESKSYLRNQLLRDADWASMAHSVELRTPLVDCHLLQSLLPYLAKFPDFHKKILLANAPSLALPEAVIRRQKTGFGIPVPQWLSGKNGSVRTKIQDKWVFKVAEYYEGWAPGKR